MNGYAGRILRVSLTDRSISTIPTGDYEQWGGGHGMGSAIFWDLCREKAISGFDPRNVITIMTSPLTGTLVPSAAGRTEMQGIGVQSSPIEWFTRSNFGGRFGSMLKYAGWDGVVIEGRADTPVWVDIRDGEVHIRDAGNLWGSDTRSTQQEICRIVMGNMESGQRPAVLSIGQAGENLSRIASVVHDAGHGSGQGGFGGVWGSKNLKAISVTGSGGINIADPNALMEARLWSKKYYSFNVDDPENARKINVATLSVGFGAPGIPTLLWQRPKQSRPHACIGCHTSCRSRYSTGHGNESSCASTAFYSYFDAARNSGMVTRLLYSFLSRLGQTGLVIGLQKKWSKNTDAVYIATDLVQKYGINTYELWMGLNYLNELHRRGILGPGKPVNCDLDFNNIGTLEFVEEMLHRIAYREGIGDDLAEGFYRAAARWGRLEKDSATGLLPFSCWGLPDHYDARAQIEWGYGSILGDRDVNEHDFVNPLHWVPTSALWARKKPAISAEELVRLVAGKLEPYEGDSLMLDYSAGNIYSDHIVKLVAWHRHYSRFWKQSMLFCDYRFADFYNTSASGNEGMTGEGEPRFLNAVTGKNISFADGMELGRKIWNLDNAIWTLQGRHRDMVHFAPYIYNRKFKGMGSLTRYFVPGREKGEWKYIAGEGKSLDRARFDEWKTKFYKFEGWDPDTGWPTRTTLESMGLGYVADELDRKSRLGRE